jgi:hypothetical protein
MKFSTDNIKAIFDNVYYPHMFKLRDGLKRAYCISILQGQLSVAGWFLEVLMLVETEFVKNRIMELEDITL